MVKINVFTFITILFVITVSLVSCSNDIKAINGSTTFSKYDTLSALEVEVQQLYVEEQKPKVLTEQERRLLLREVYMNEVGVRELTGKNDGKRVTEYLNSVNLGSGYAWCAAFVKWCFDQITLNTRITAWSPTAHNSKNVIYAKHKFHKEPQPGDVFTLYYASKKRIGHTGFFDKWNNENVIQTVEGNTDGEGSREGDGVYIKFRPIKTIHSITSWF